MIHVHLVLLVMSFVVAICFEMCLKRNVNDAKESIKMTLGESDESTES